jgi:SAM-dependent methyltransferase
MRSASDPLETFESAIREGKQRLHPSLSNPSWLVLRRRREIFKKWLAEYDSEDLSILDIGGRVQPYRPLLKQRLRRYVAVDLRRTPLVNIIARGEQIPLTGNAFDLAICTQVLQYVAEPAAMVSEIHRLLKPGGYLFLSVPAIYPRDSEMDQWRFSPQWLRVLLRSFDKVEIVAEGSSVSGLFRSVCICLSMFAKPAFVRTLVQFTIVPLLNVAAVLCESVLGSSNEQFTANYSVRARK